jgi:hypothetical protein
MQRDESLWKLHERRCILLAVLRLRATSRRNELRTTAILLQQARQIQEDLTLRNSSSLVIMGVSFDLNILSERETILRFRFYKRDIVTISGQTQWNPALRCLRRESDGKLHTTRRRYVFTPTGGICILLRRLSSPCRWTDLQAEFGRHNAALVEIFYAALDSFFDTFNQLVTKCPSGCV